MKYCVHYHRNSPFKYFDEIDEIEITYKKEDLTLPAFLEKYVLKTIVISVQETADIERLKELYAKYKNFKLKINILDKELTKVVMDSGIPYFFSALVDDWDSFVGIIDLNPTDIYIVNELGFELNKIAEIAHRKNIAIRVFPNVAQSRWEGTVDMKKFFIRPEDLYLYEPYIDVIEFFGHEKQSSIYYETYAQDKRWFGKLKEIIISFNSEVDSRGIISAFAQNRIKCGKRCLKDHPCNICERTEHLANTLENQSLLIKVNKQ